MTSLFAYRKHIDAIHTRELRLPDAHQGQQSGLELCTLADGRAVVAMFDGFTLPAEQHVEIAPSIEPLTLTNALREEIKAASPHVRLIGQRMQEQIRSKYSTEDEMYFARIGVGSALGVYVFETGEAEALAAYGAHVEAVRQWGRAERAKLGLADATPAAHVSQG